MDWNLIKRINGLKSISQIGAATAGGNAIAAFFWIYMADLMGQEDYGELGYHAFYCRLSHQLFQLLVVNGPCQFILQKVYE